MSLSRSLEAQLTDFENAAFTIFISLIGRAILFFKLNLYMPLSKVDENMKRAHHRDAVTKEKFFFRKHIGEILFLELHSHSVIRLQRCL
jgi:glutamate--cysteine ligase catalytic subunit